MTQSINIVKFLAFLAAGIIAFFLITNLVSAQSATPNPEASPDSSTVELEFPIEDLGGCDSMEACANYCEDPINHNSCENYAKEKGFYKDDAVLASNDEFWQNANNELGCDSREACLTYCSEPANHEACDSFAKRNNVSGGYTDQPDKPEYLQIAKDTLGCDSLDSCATICDDPANAQKCSDFANQVGLLGGEETEGPLGCQTPESCQNICSDPANFQICQVYSGENFSGPGGCDSEKSCFEYCEQNAEECRAYAPGTNGAYVPITCPDGTVHGIGGSCVAPAEPEPDGICGSGAIQYGEGCLPIPIYDGPCSEGQYSLEGECIDIPPGIDPDILTGNFDPRPDMNNCATPGECYDYCIANEGACPGFQPGTGRPSDDYNPYIYYTPGSEVTFEPKPDMGNCNSPGSCYDFCKDNPNSCQGFDANSPRPLDVYVPGTYYTPPTDAVYVTPPATNFYTTPVYFTPPPGSNYTTPQYYTPGHYSTPTYYTPPQGSNYTTPTYYTPGRPYYSPSGEYPTPNYNTPYYYTPPIGSNYTTPYYYTPAPYNTPYYYTPPQGSNYTTPNYVTPPPYTTPQYYTPYSGGNYSTPTYYTPPVYSTPTYYTPPEGSNYTSPSYYTPPPPYTSPSYYTPGTYPTPAAYTTPPPYTTPQYYTPPPGSNYTSPTYYTPQQYGTPTYYTPPPYYTPAYYTPYSSPTYYTPPEGSNYTSPTYYTPYGTPSGTTSYYYPTPSSGTYGTPTGYGTPYYGTPGDSYYSPSYSYPSPDAYYSPGSYTPSYGSPTYGSPTYGSPTYGTPEYSSPSYGSPSYGTPSEPPPPSSSRGRVASAKTSLFRNIYNFFRSIF